MRLSVIGGVNYAFEMEWKGIGNGQTADDVAKEYAAEGGKWLYCTYEPADGQSFIGIGELEEGAKLPKMPVRSFAMAMAKAGDSGIYAAIVPENDEDEPPLLWYVVIENGLILANTDKSVPLIEGVESINNLMMVSNFQLYTLGDIDGLDGEYFDPETMVAGIETPKLKVCKSGLEPRTLILGAAITAVLGLCGFVAYDYYQEKSAASQAGDDIELQKAAYIGQVQSVGSAMPVDSFWLRDELVDVYQTFPPSFAGWNLDGVDCLPQGCTATFSPSQDGFSMRAMQERYGKDRLNWDGQAHVLKVTKRPKKQWVMQQWSEIDILTPTAVPVSTLDILGSLPTMYAGVAGKETNLELTTQFAGSGFAGRLFQETMETSGAFYFDPLLAAGMVNDFAKKGFVATKFSVTRASSSQSEKWMVEWMRLNGDSGD